MRNHLWLAAALVLLGLTWWLETSRPFENGRAPSSKKSAVRAYEVLDSASLVDHRDNDGDSFLVQHQGGTHIFRLHFVDAPEKRLHQFNADRLQQQARYFGELTQEQVLAMGQRARDYTLAALAQRRFTVHTRWREVYDSGRFYAFVLFEDGGDLMEELVAQGLVRIYTEGAQHPDGRSESEYRKRLQALEADAKRARRGAWGLR